MICPFCESSEHSCYCDREQLKRIITRLRETIRVRTLELEATRKIDAQGVIMIQSLISHRDHKPRINIQLGELHTQMEAAAAMDVAKNIIECACGAYADAFIFHFISEKLKQSDSVGLQIIEDFRDYRETLMREFNEGST